MLKLFIEICLFTAFSSIHQDVTILRTVVLLLFKQQNSLDAGIQDRSRSISIMYKIEEMSYEEEEEGEDDESDKHIVRWRWCAPRGFPEGK